MKKTIITLLLSLFAAKSIAFAQGGEPFPEINVPAIYTDQASYVAYYIAHYWDRYNFAAYDKKYSEETTGQAFANFAYLL